MGRFDEAFREMERARQLDPLSLIVASDNAVTLLYSRAVRSRHLGVPGGAGNGT